MRTDASVTNGDAGLANAPIRPCCFDVPGLQPIPEGDYVFGHLFSTSVGTVTIINDDNPSESNFGKAFGGSAGRVVATADVFNLFNTTNFNLPGNLADEPATFGRILSAQAPREVQLSVRFGL